MHSIKCVSKRQCSWASYVERIASEIIHTQVSEILPIKTEKYFKCINNDGLPIGIRKSNTTYTLLTPASSESYVIFVVFST